MEPDGNTAAKLEAAITLAIRSAPHAAQAKTIEFIHRAFSDEADEMDRTIAASLIEGVMVVVGLSEQGALLFRLTQRGRDSVLDLITTRPDMREFWNSLSASRDGGPVLSEPPKDKQ